MDGIGVDPRYPHGFIPDKYLPGDKVWAMHNLPRFTGGNDFDASSKEYFEGIVLTAIPFAIIGLIVSLVLLCCACCCCKRQQLTAGQQAKGICLPWILSFVFLAFLFLGGSLGANGNEVAGGAVDGLLATLQSLEQQLTAASTSVAEAKQIASNADMSLDAVANKCPAVQTEANKVKDDITSLVSNLNSFDIASVVSSLKQVSDPIDQYEGTRYSSVFACCFFFFVLVILYLLGLIQALFCNFKCATNTCSVVGKILLFFATFIVITMWLITGVGIAFSALNADFCVAPDASFNSVVSVFSSEGLGPWSYYQTCTGSPPASIVNALNQSSAFLTDADNKLQQLQQVSGAACVTPVTTEIAALQTDLTNSRKILDQAENLVSCVNVNSYYRAFINDFMCTELMASLVQFWVGALLVGIFMTFMQLSFKTVLDRRLDQDDTMPKQYQVLDATGRPIRQGQTAAVGINADVRERY